MIDMNYELVMEAAIKEAKKSKAKGNKGYGAAIAKDSKIVSLARDTVKQTRDPSSHAEMNAIRKAAKKIGSDLNGCTLVSTCEPCPMCGAAAIWANIDTIVFGASIEETLKLGRERIVIPLKELAAKSPHKINIIGGILKEKCLKLYER